MMNGKGNTLRFASTRIKFSFKSIKTKIIALFLVISLVPLISIAIFFSVYLKNNITGEIHDKLEAYATSNAQNVDYMVTRNISIINQMLATNSVKSSDDTGILTLLRYMKGMNTEVEDYTYVDADDMAITSDGTHEKLNNREYIKQARETKQPAASDMLVSKATGNHVVVVMVPQLDESQNYVGGIMCTLDITNMNTITNGIKIGEKGSGYLISPAGTLLTYPDPAMVGKNIDEAFGSDVAAKIRQNVLQKDKGTFTMADNGNEKLEINFDTVPSTGWRLVTFAVHHEMYAPVNTANQVSVILIVITAILVIAASFFLAVMIAKPILAVTTTVKKLATGDLTPRLAIKSKDELGDLGSHMNQMLVSFTDIVNRASDVSEQLAASSEELTAASVESVDISNRIANATQEVLNANEAQLRGSEQTSTALMEMALGVQRIAESSSVVTEAAHLSMQEVQEGDVAIRQAIRQMEAVRDSVNQSSENIRMLESYSKKIDEVVAVITGITKQTNILAINAAIEAARAGAQGRGFAVVANEVKKLAEQSAVSANKISEMIGEIQTTTSHAVHAMKQEVKDVESGSELINTAGEIFGRILNTFSEISNQIQEVSAASQEMSAGTEEITASMSEIVQMAESTVEHTEGIADGSKRQLASMKDISASAEDLSRMAQELQESLSRFQTK
ncbi:methyl-accepting chemotaxis protein [Cohnella caldifontis]|uniref:methyl-accepting chemotaxis protein n=1 Tax=Cohnella caldifontis TaxID=3027471 RepID=UPI0023EC7C80|nr:methyl-accepting chemotaxis protein [Cohnella sp. YIM B05605]